MTGWKQVFRIWSSILEKKFGRVEADFLVSKLKQRYIYLSSNQPLFANSIIRRHLVNNLIPGLALYHVLKDYYQNQAKALSEVNEFFAATILVSAERTQLLMMRWLPDPFSLMNFATRLQLLFDYPKEGWTLKKVVNNRNALGFDTTHCIYVDILKTYGAPELTPSFCQMDNYLMKDIPFARFERTMTLANGDPACDFRYFRINPS